MSFASFANTGFIASEDASPSCVMPGAITRRRDDDGTFSAVKRIPIPGDVLAMTFGKREAICRVIADTPDCPLTSRMCRTRGPTPMICVIVTRWDGPAGSATEGHVRRSARARQARMFNRWAGTVKKIGCWLSAEAPRRPFRAVGFVALAATERALAAHPDDAHRKTRQKSITGKITEMDDWISLRRMTAAQWEWDHNRAAIVAAQKREAEREKASDLRAARALAKARKQLAKAGVRSLTRTRFFTDWRGEVPAKMIAACEKLAHEAVVALSQRKDRTHDATLADLKALMRRYNALDGKYQHSFSTMDAETIVETVLDIATAVGVDEPLFDRAIDPVRAF